MNLSNLADFADFLAAGGVIASLMFLAYQIRLNTSEMKNQHWESHLDRLAACFSRQLDTDVASVINKGRTNFDDLDPSEKIVFNAWASEYLANVFSSIGFHNQQILDSDRAVQGERRLQWLFSDRGVVQWWRDPSRHPVPQKYERMVDDFLLDQQRKAS